MPDLGPTSLSTTTGALSTGARPPAPSGLPTPSRPLRVGAFNRLDRTAAIDLVQPCFPVERWWTAVVDARPYADHESLLAVARGAADPLTGHELDLALAGYLGVRAADWLPALDLGRPGSEESAAVLLDRIAEDSRAYLARFGRPFVIRTPGRSTSEVATHLRRRLGHDLPTEDRATAGALRQIGLLALVRRVGS